MTDTEKIAHFLTERGALCGAAPGPHPRWSLIESRTTCAACRALLEERARREVTKPIGRLLKIE